MAHDHSEWQINPGTRDDLQLFVRALQAVTGPTEPPLSEAAARSAASVFLDDPQCTTLVAVNSAGRAGGALLAGGTEVCDRSGRKYLLASVIYVEPWAEGGNCMDVLVAAGRRLARARRMKGLRGMVHKDNERARKAFRKRGFVEPGYLVIEIDEDDSPLEPPASR